MSPRPNHCQKMPKAAWPLRLLGIASTVTLWLAGCSTPPAPGSAPAKDAPLDLSNHASAATSAKDYRKDAATHVYAQQKDRVLKGRLPPMLYAVGVLNVNIDRQGQVRALEWKRAPQHAPEVIADIERIVRTAAPYPIPTRLGQVTWTDVWLWDKSGRFQLDTLTEGQD